MTAERKRKRAKRTTGAIAKVWAFFDTLPPGTRWTDAVAAAVAAGFNENTVRTQHHYWRRDREEAATRSPQPQTHPVFPLELPSWGSPERSPSLLVAAPENGLSHWLDSTCGSPQWITFFLCRHCQDTDWSGWGMAALPQPG